MMVKDVGSQSGTFIGYRVERKNQDGIWKTVKFEEVEKHGIQRSHLFQEIHFGANVFGIEAAFALAWSVKANDEYFANVRLVPCKVKFSINVEACDPVDIAPSQEMYEKLNPKELKPRENLQV